jgi:hypothetical protein
MRRYAFTLVLTGVREITSRLANGLYEALDGDTEFGMCDGVARLDVLRRGHSRQAAIDDAIRCIEDAHLGVKVVRVESTRSNRV